MGWDGIGTLIGKVADWLPGRKESKENRIAKLQKENDELQKEKPLSVKSALRMDSNTALIKRLRDEIARIK